MEAPIKRCISCNKEFKPSKNSRDMYCSNKCQMNKQHEDYIERWLRGEEKGWVGRTRSLSKRVRRWVRETKGEACEWCGWNEKHPVDNSILTEIDHIDGDTENVTPDNLRVLCPNCHSMTPTFRARNKSSKRIR